MKIKTTEEIAHKIYGLNDQPSVYVACLGCYNEGRLHGKWMDADELEQRWESPRHWDSSTGLSQCKKPHHDEWAIHDYDGVPNLGEHPDIPYLIKVMQADRKSVV